MSLLVFVATCLSFAAAVAASIVILLQNKNSLINRWLAVFLVAIGSWGFISSQPSINDSSEYNLILIRAAFVAVLFVAYALFQFSLSLADRKLPNNIQGILGVAFLVAEILSTSSLVISNVIVSHHVILTLRQPLYFVVVPFAILMVFASIYVIFQKRRNTIEIAERQRYTIILLGLVTGMISGILTNVVLANTLTNVQPSHFAWISTLIWTSVLLYAMIKHRFLDIQLAALRTLVYGLVLLTLSSLYYLLAYFVSVALLGGHATSDISVSPINITLALVLAFLFQPIKRFFDRVTNSIFYRDVYKSEDFFAELSELLASSTDLRGLLERASMEIAETFKAEQCFFFLYYTNSEDHHMSAGTSGHSRLPLADARMLNQYVRDYDPVIVTDALPETAKIRRILISYKIELLMPLMRGSQVIGYVCLGGQQSGHYTARDVNVLKTIANELVIAIQNALSVHEVKEINATLQQRIDIATKELRESNAQLQRLDAAKDEFVSMASHQLRTPLTSVKGYISMLLDGDAGKLTETQSHLLDEAFKSSERMVGLISDFLSVSRVQTGRFVIELHPGDLTQIVSQEVDSLKEIARSHDLLIDLVAPKTPVPVMIDEEKVRQIIMNFIDNAIYYSHPNTRINVTLKVENDQAVLTVTDHGIGVPEREQSKLFAKFFRATNARKQRPDGTGVGLYLAKKVIMAHHGKLVFQSEEGIGSTFGFKLPVEQADDADSQKDESK